VIRNGCLIGVACPKAAVFPRCHAAADEFYVPVITSAEGQEEMFFRRAEDENRRDMENRSDTWRRINSTENQKIEFPMGNGCGIS